MRHPIALLALASLLSAALPAVELPGGSSARLEGTDGTGYVKLVPGSGRNEYYASVESLVGILPKANGRGCELFIQTDTGVQKTEVETDAPEILKAVKESRFGTK